MVRYRSWPTQYTAKIMCEGRPSILSGPRIESMKDIFIQIFPWLEIQNGLRTIHIWSEKSTAKTKLKHNWIQMRHYSKWNINVVMLVCSCPERKSFSFVLSACVSSRDNSTYIQLSMVWINEVAAAATTTFSSFTHSLIVQLKCCISKNAVNHEKAKKKSREVLLLFSLALCSFSLVGTCKMDKIISEQEEEDEVATATRTPTKTAPVTETIKVIEQTRRAYSTHTQ